MIMISHDLSVLSATCERLAVMYAGRVVEEGPRARSSPTPGTPTPRRWPGPSRSSATSGPGSEPARPGGDPPDPADLPSGCSFHPRCAVAEPECSTSGDGALAGRAWPRRPPASGSCPAARASRSERHCYESG